MTERTLPGGGVIDDKRTSEEKVRTFGFIVATDSFMSGRGLAPGRSLFAVPVKNGAQVEIVFENMKVRSDMKRPRFVSAQYRPHLKKGDHLCICSMANCDRFYTSGGFKQDD